MKRGEVWTVAGGPDYTGKPRPVAILQDDRFEGLESITFCPFTTNPTPAPLFRLPVQPSDRNGLREESSLMADKITTVARVKLGKRIGRLDDEDVVRLNRAVMVFLGLAGVGQLMRNGRGSRRRTTAYRKIVSGHRAAAPGRRLSPRFDEDLLFEVWWKA